MRITFSRLAISLGIVLSILSGCKKQNSSPVSDELRSKAIETLDEVLANQELWVKVHAAEYKLWAGYPDGVKDIYLREKELFDSLPQYRVGIWRVLAQASLDDAEIYRDHIVKAFENREGNDRIHAAETAAKLGYSLAELSPEATAEVLAGERNSLYVYTLWSTLHSENPGRGVEALIELVLDPGLGELPKTQAAFSLGNFGRMSDEQWEKLAMVALEEPKESLSRVYLLSAAFVHAPDKFKQEDTFQQMRSSLLALKKSPNKGERMEMALALGKGGDKEDRDILEELLEGKNPIVVEGDSMDESLADAVNADVKATAAYSLLAMDRRQEYALAWGDWIVMIAYLLGMVGIGFYYSRKNKNPKDYYLGGGKMNPVAVGLSLFATLLSSLSYLSYPGEMVKYGPVIFSGVLVFPLVYYVVGWFLIPKFMKLRVTSAYEILEINLGVSIRLLATFFFLSLRFLWMGTIIFVTVHAAILSIFNIDPSYAMLISVSMMGVTIYYTTLGGMKAVVLTDVIQSGVMVGGALFTILVVCWYFGSFTSWIPGEWLTHWGDFKIGLNARERLTIGNALLTTFVWYIASSGSDQMAIQRFLSTENVHAARKTFGISLWSTFVTQALLGLVGLAVLAYFMKFPHYLGPGETVSTHADQLFPKFILIGLPVGITGLVAAAILAAAMSSLSSGLNSASSVISEDLLNRFSERYRKKTNQLPAIRNLSLFVGILSLLLSMLISRVEGNLYDVIVKVVNLFVSPLFVLFFMALFVPFATDRGTFWGGIGSVAIAVAIAFYKFMGIEVLFIMPVSLVVGVFLGTLLSWVDHRMLGNPETMKKRSREAAIVKDPVTSELNV